MHIFATILIVLSALITSSLGYPAGALAPWVECPTQTQWYTCSKNNFRGCCSVDPCDLPSCPAPRPVTSFQRKCTPGTHKIYQPTLYNLDPFSPDSADRSTSTISLSKSNEQVAIFGSVPSSARNCSVNWSTGAISSFNVSGNGLVEIRVVDGNFFTGPYTWNRVHEWLRGVIGQADFTSWPDYPGAWDHPVSRKVLCAEEMAFWTIISGTNNDNVRLVQDIENGWYLEYDC